MPLNLAVETHPGPKAAEAHETSSGFLGSGNRVLRPSDLTSGSTCQFQSGPCGGAGLIVGVAPAVAPCDPLAALVPRLVWKSGLRLAV